MDKCVHCPLVGDARPCRAQTTGHRRYCELVDPDSPDYRPSYIDFLKGVAPDLVKRAMTEAEVARQRRAAKPRVPLGTKPKGG